MSQVLSVTVTVTPAVDPNRLHPIDQDELSIIEGTHAYEINPSDLPDITIDDPDFGTMNRLERARHVLTEAALDQFHDEVAIKVLDDFLIVVEPAPAAIHALLGKTRSADAEGPSL